MASPPSRPSRRADDEPAQVVSGAAHERYAVSDGPNGTRVVVAPADRMLAADVKALNHRFWCSTAANGCGSRLSFKVGKIRTPPVRLQTWHGMTYPTTTDYNARRW